MQEHDGDPPTSRQRALGPHGESAQGFTVTTGVGSGATDLKAIRFCQYCNGGDTYVGVRNSV